jgi:hypothetical protein
MSTIFGMKEGGSALPEEEYHFCVFLSSRRPPVELPSMGSLPYSLVFTLRLAPLCEGVVTSLAAVRAVIAREWAARRTGQASTDWNDRGSRSHSVFRIVIESGERGDTSGGRQTPGLLSHHQHLADQDCKDEIHQCKVHNDSGSSMLIADCDGS